MKFTLKIALLLGIALLLSANHASATTCPSTSNTNTDCAYIITIGLGGSITGAPVAGAAPYDGVEDSLVGVINNSGSTFTGSIFLSGNDIFGFDGDGICSWLGGTSCGPTGYEGPLNTFSNIDLFGNSGDVNITGLLSGQSTYFSLEGAPGALNITVGTPEPGTLLMLGTGLLTFVGAFRRRLSA